MMLTTSGESVFTEYSTPQSSFARVPSQASKETGHEFSGIGFEQCGLCCSYLKKTHTFHLDCKTSSCD